MVAQSTHHKQNGHPVGSSCTHVLFPTTYLAKTPFCATQDSNLLEFTGHGMASCNACIVPLLGGFDSYSRHRKVIGPLLRKLISRYDSAIDLPKSTYPQAATLGWLQIFLLTLCLEAQGNCFHMNAFRPEGISALFCWSGILIGFHLIKGLLDCESGKFKRLEPVRDQPRISEYYHLSVSGQMDGRMRIKDELFNNWDIRQN
ncbi:hypothetical protein GALMADRAFT_218507 [Galerina marginata CBS 339.88]|uniref:Uncharacterized protein n=1 Tax=Galerina marginata (strain CBS 339.88) TaxID=685588 RepID=A0A067TSX4_GALM3|nr:hypothetical protein GALMADRAFT_218507 [Galerina marginata CBS 339.88]